MDATSRHRVGADASTNRSTVDDEVNVIDVGRLDRARCVVDRRGLGAVGSTTSTCQPQAAGRREHVASHRAGPATDRHRSERRERLEQALGHEPLGHEVGHDVAGSERIGGARADAATRTRRGPSVVQGTSSRRARWPRSRRPSRRPAVTRPPARRPVGRVVTTMAGASITRRRTLQSADEHRSLLAARVTTTRRPKNGRDSNQRGRARRPADHDGLGASRC